MTKANDIQHGGDHYKGAEYQHWDWANDCRLHGLTWAATKYAARWRKKDGEQDVNKAIHYCDKAMEVGVVGSSVGKRFEYYWRFVTNNAINMWDARIIFYMMEGQWPAAREALLALLPQPASDRL